MEVLSIETVHWAKVVGFLLFLGLLCFSVFKTVAKESNISDRIFGVFTTIFTVIMLTNIALTPAITYYDVIVTDWNAVYDQGYEVVEQKGKIVTLRKVGD